MVQHTTLEGRWVAGIVEARLHRGRCQACKLSEVFGASLLDQPTQFALVIGEIKEWGLGGKFLTLEQERDPRRQQGAGAGASTQPSEFAE
jgi:hypothetical protein